MNPASLGVARIREFNGVKLVVDGNSIYANEGGIATMADVLKTMAPLAGTSATTLNLAFPGQSWAQMDSASSDVDGAFDSSKTCILVCGETTNSVGNQNKTGAAAYADAVAYLAARRAANPKWKIVLCSGLPRDGNGSQKTLEVVAADALMRANWRSIGVDAFVDFRQPGSPFAHDGTSAAAFQAQQSLWQETSGWLHPSAAGKAIMAQYVVSDGLRKLTKR